MLLIVLCSQPSKRHADGIQFLFLNRCGPNRDQLMVHSHSHNRVNPTAPQIAALPTATVISTGDGNTLRLNLNGVATTTRIACIDAPESNQAFGPEASARLATLLPRGSAVTVRTVAIDRYGRTVAEV